MKKIFMLLSLMCLLSAPLFSQIIEFNVDIKYKTETSAKTAEVTITVTSGTPAYQYFITTHDPVNGEVLFKSEKTGKNRHTFKGVKPGTYLIKIQDSTGMYAGKSIVIEN